MERKPTEKIKQYFMRKYPEDKEQIYLLMEELKENYVHKNIFNIKHRALMRSRKIIKYNEFKLRETWHCLRVLGIDDKKFKKNIDIKWERNKLKGEQNGN